MNSLILGLLKAGNGGESGSQKEKESYHRDKDNREGGEEFGADIIGGDSFILMFFEFPKVFLGSPDSQTFFTPEEFDVFGDGVTLKGFKRIWIDY